MADEQDVNKERAALRAAQARRVMPLIGALLDAADGLPGDLRSDLEEFAPDLCRILAAINDAMEADRGTD